MVFFTYSMINLASLYPPCLDRGMHWLVSETMCWLVLCFFFFSLSWNKFLLQVCDSPYLTLLLFHQFRRAMLWFWYVRKHQAEILGLFSQHCVLRTKPFGFIAFHSLCTFSSELDIVLECNGGWIGQTPWLVWCYIGINSQLVWLLSIICLNSNCQMLPISLLWQ